jgi:putative ABC transport system ATP-binding protein
MKQSVLRAENLHKHYGKGAGKVVAVHDVSLDVIPGDIVLVMGPSGSGKTTLLTMLGSLLTPDDGKVYYGNKLVTGLPAKKLTDERADHLGFVFQSFNLMPSLNVWENVAVVLELTNKNGHPRAKAEKVLKQLGMGHRLTHRINQLSGGEKQRVAVARALVAGPSVILADEPTANLDSKNGHDVAMLLSEAACREGRAVVIVSHDIRLRDVAKRIITIEDGRLVREEKGGHDKTCRLEHKNA